VTPGKTIARSTPSSFAALRRFSQVADSRRKGESIAAPAVEQCELCSLRLAPQHRHLLEVATRRIVCACDGCATTFVPVIGGRFKVIPRDARALPAFQISDADWENLALPISLAFFFHHSTKGKMTALYPSPAGATESLLSLSAWESIARENPILAGMQSDVEALLVNRANEAREYFIAPIDRCFELVGLIRMHWRGFGGGEEVWREIEGFFAALHAGT
jgi:hypothetical protein